MQSPLYFPAQESNSEFIDIRGWRYHVRHWMTDARSDTRPPLVMLHGFMDVAASFQFVIDALPTRRHVIALDWRGFGLTEPQTISPLDTYWFPDYLGDLDGLLDALCPNKQIHLLGHSMGGYIAMTYAGVRPERIRKLINIEGFGLPDTTPEQAPMRYRKWLDQLLAPQRLRSYATLEDVAARMQASNPRLTTDKAIWLAAHWSRQEIDGRWHLLIDPAHKRINPILYREEEAAACRKQITAPTLCVDGAQSTLLASNQGANVRSIWQTRLAVVPQLRSITLEDCGHMIHHDQPTILAHAITDFFNE